MNCCCTGVVFLSCDGMDALDEGEAHGTLYHVLGCVAEIPAEYWDARASACVWNFRAAKVGATTVGCVGTAIRKPGQACLAYAIYEEFPITVL